MDLVKEELEAQIRVVRSVVALGRSIRTSEKLRTRQPLAEATILTHDPEVKIYEVEPGLDAITAPLAGEPEGPSFHFVLNNKVYKDNRIPPRGFTNAAFADFGGTPVGATYADGQYWDVTPYAIPPGATSADVTLFYQSTSKEFVEFLRDENVTNTKGQEMYDLWNDNGKSPPEVVQNVVIPVPEPGGLAMLLAGAGFLATLGRRRARR